MADDIRREDITTYPSSTDVANALKRISWGAVWAGVMIALGMEVLFTVFGFFIGFGMYHSQAANPWSGVAGWSTIWYLVTAGWSLFFGAWCASRLSGDPVTGDGVLHGITTWGLTTTATILIVAVASWAVLREGIDVLSTATIAAEQAAPSAVASQTPVQPAAGTREAGPITSQLQANPGPVAQATADIISSLSLRIFGGVLLGFVTSLIGGWLGRSRRLVLEPVDIVTIPSRRAA